jgi:PTH1 family peptidyl-tRNA hydrolase
LGNPGPSYSQSRHNVGFRTVDLLSSKLGIHLKRPVFKRFLIGRGFLNGEAIILAKPLTYMNRAGEAVNQLLKYTDTKQEDLIVVCDSLDLQVGSCRLKSKGSSAGQKGLESIIKHTKTTNFLRLSIGIGRPRCKDDIIRYVLSIPAKKDRLILEDAVERAAEAIAALTRDEPEKVMNVLNQRTK